MYDVMTREIPARSVLTLKRSVEGNAGAFAFGKEFLSILREGDLPRLVGPAGAAFAIYWGEVNEDSDGPIEWCRPVPADRAEQLAARVPRLTLRTEPAHREAVIELGLATRIEPAQWQLISESMREWVEEHAAGSGGLGVRGDLGVRVVYRWDGSTAMEQGPDCDFAMPLA